MEKPQQLYLAPSCVLGVNDMTVTHCEKGNLYPLRRISLNQSGRLALINKQAHIATPWGVAVHLTFGLWQ
jgi:hypothetical protein